MKYYFDNDDRAFVENEDGGVRFYADGSTSKQII